MLNNVEVVGYVEEVGEDPFEGKPAASMELAMLMPGMWGNFIYGLDPNVDDVMFPRRDLDGMLIYVLATGPNPYWPVYANSLGHNYASDANVTSLAYVEVDTFRVEANN